MLVVFNLELKTQVVQVCEEKGESNRSLNIQASVVLVKKESHSRSPPGGDRL